MAAPRVDPQLAGDSTDYDGGWKEGLEPFFEPFLQLCFPSLSIIWSATGGERG